MHYIVIHIHVVGLHRGLSWLVILQDTLQTNVSVKRNVTMCIIVHVYRNTHAYTHGIALAYVHIILFLCTHKYMLQFTVSLSTYLAPWVKINC